MVKKILSWAFIALVVLILVAYFLYYADCAQRYAGMPMGDVPYECARLR